MLNAASTIAQDAGLRQKHFNLKDGVAIQGYDPVAYFLQNRAIKGSREFAFVCNGVAYYFTSEADLAEFRKNPEIYEPQYGGWCAYAMGKDGTKVEVDPETFKIVNGKLFLFYNQFFTNTLKSWNKDEVELHHHADLNWTKIFH
jgi:YHS domain-containing protein